MRMLFDWFDDRTGIRQFVHAALYEHIPGGSRWRYVWGSTLVFTFTVQVVTGAFLWMAYSPSAQTAWESVYYIQHEMQGGWFLRGLHHYTAQAMVVLLALHMMQVVVDGAYRAPREVNFWLGLILLQLVLALSLTGYLLPWDQKGYWATQVATKLMGVVPGIGDKLQSLVVGGPNYGHHTLSRFFALHAGILPGLLIAVLVAHVALFRRHGIHARDPDPSRDSTFWPDQVLKDSVACLAVLVVILGLVARHAITGGETHARPADYLGADLGAPADASEPYPAARPEWYFLFLFQLLKYFEGDKEIYGAIVVPGVVMFAIFLMPIVGRWRLGHGFNVGLLFCLLIGVAGLTVQAMVEDRKDPRFQQAVAEAEASARRVKQLAQSPTGIPPTGAVTLLRDDPMSEGRKLFARYCAVCHSFQSDAGEGLAHAQAPSASNLHGFATRQWLSRLLDPKGVDSVDYFGATKHREGEMVSWVKENLAELDGPGRENLRKAVIALSAEAALPAQRAADAKDAKQAAEGRELIKSQLGCIDCHRFHDAGELGTAPDLTGYGSRDWLIAFVSNPGDERFYADRNDRMPAYAPHADDPHRNDLSPKQLALIVDFLRGDWYEPRPGR